MGEEEVSWKSPSYRQKVIEQIQDARTDSTSTSAVTKSSEELEEHIFNKATSKHEYISLIARLILFLRNRSTVYTLLGEPPVPGFHVIKNGNGHRGKGSNGNGNHWGNPHSSYMGSSPHLPPYHHHSHHQPSSTYVPSRRQKMIHNEEDLEKCHKFLSMCMQMAVCLTEKKKQSTQILVQDLIDGKRTAADFVEHLLKELKAPKQPSLVTFIDKNLERLRQALVSGELWFSGIRPPGMEGPIPMPHNVSSCIAPPPIPAGLGMEGEGRLIVPASPNFYQPNIQGNNHHHQHPHHPGIRPNNHHHHPPPHHHPQQQQQQLQQPPQHQSHQSHQSQMHMNNSQGSLCADLLTSSFPESGNVMQELFDFMGTSAPDSFAAELGPMRQSGQDVDNYMWGNNVNVNTSMGQYAHHGAVGHINNGSNGPNGLNMPHGPNGSSMGHPPNIAMPPPSTYQFQNGMRMQNTGTECLISPQGSNNHLGPHPSNLVSSSHPQTLHGISHNNGAPINGGRNHLMHQMLGGYLDEKMQG